MLQLVALIGADCITDRLTGLMWSKNGMIGSAATAGGAPLTQPDFNAEKNHRFVVGVASLRH